MDKVNLPHLEDDIVLGARDFFVAAQSELARVQRYGGQSTFLLIKPHLNSNESNTDYITSLYHCIKEQLRHCDAVYLLKDGEIAAILPNTHEAGGETASFRLKKEVSRFRGPQNETIPMSIGVVSVWQDRCPNVTELLDELSRDLERDDTCQILPEKREEKERVKLLLLVDEKTKAALQKLFPREVELIDSAENDVPDLLIADEEHLHQNDIKLKKYQKLHGLHYKIHISDENRNFLLLSSSELAIEKLLAKGCIPSTGRNFSISDKERELNSEKKFRDILSAIGATTHQMNQPLQIIMGKIELLLLDLSLEEEISPDTLRKSLEKVKEQVHYASEINAKINRLTKI